ncbi:MAG TPA: response regulator [Solirubrobacteraceae bacterium]|nr:response regulator [Solirubrobacteraceae bacterium]
MAHTETHLQPAEPDLNGLPILAVDDEESNLLLLRVLLHRAGYTNVKGTTDPSEVPELFVKNHPSLVILDLHMPEMDGFELIERLAAMADERRTTPFLVVTADVTEETRRSAISAGASDFLTKPLDRTELLVRVRNLLHIQHLQDRLYGEMPFDGDS